MKLQIAKWGHGLVVRLPVNYLRTAGLQAGDTVEATLSPTGDMTLHADKSFDKSAFLQLLKKLQIDMPMTAPVVESMRESERY